MIEFGKSLKAAREAKGLTIAQMVEITHLAPTTINELEVEDFSRIAAPIYGRGFVKLYCEAVGLDPKPFVAEFMDIFSGNHDTGIKERPVAPVASEPPSDPAETASAPAETPPPPVETVSDFNPPPEELPTVDGQVPPIIKQPLVSRQRDLFFDEPELPAPAQEPVPAPAPIPALASEVSFPGERIESPAHNDHSFSRYAEPLRQLKPLVRSPIWRIAVLAGAALALLILLVLGIRAVYRATNAVPASPTQQPTVAPACPSKQPTAKATAVPKPVAKEKKPAAPAVKTAPTPKPSARTPQKIPALYVD